MQLKRGTHASRVSCLASRQTLVTPSVSSSFAEKYQSVVVFAETAQTARETRAIPVSNCIVTVLCRAPPSQFDTHAMMPPMKARICSKGISSFAESFTGNEGTPKAHHPPIHYKSSKDTALIECFNSVGFAKPSRPVKRSQRGGCRQGQRTPSPTPVHSELRPPSPFDSIPTCAGWGIPANPSAVTDRRYIS
jgi:hypothetical protein